MVTVGEEVSCCATGMREPVTVILVISLGSSFFFSGWSVEEAGGASWAKAGRALRASRPLIVDASRFRLMVMVMFPLGSEFLTYPPPALFGNVPPQRKTPPGGGVFQGEDGPSGSASER